MAMPGTIRAKRADFSILARLSLSLALAFALSACSTQALEKHANDPNDPHAEKTDTERCCEDWSGNECVKEVVPGCSKKVQDKSIQHGLEFPMPATVTPTAPVGP